jgi:hypothetical protein
MPYNDTEKHPQHGSTIDVGTPVHILDKEAGRRCARSQGMRIAHSATRTGTCALRWIPRLRERSPDIPGMELPPTGALYARGTLL